MSEKKFGARFVCFSLLLGFLVVVGFFLYGWYIGIPSRTDLFQSLSVVLSGTCQNGRVDRQESRRNWLVSHEVRKTQGLASCKNVAVEQEQHRIVRSTVYKT